jgi:hypothetical protein
MNKLLYVLLFCLLATVGFAQDKQPTNKTLKNKKTKTAELPEVVIETARVPPMPEGYPKDEAEEYKSLHQQFEKFIKSYADIQKSKDKQSVLQFLAKDIKATFILFDIANNTSIKYTNLKSFETHLDDLITSNEMELKYNVTEILREYVQGKFGVISYVVHFEIYKYGNLWSRGNETVTLTYIKFQGEWKIVQYTFVSIEDEKLRGSCVCEVFRGKGGEQFVSKTAIPTGRSYVTNMTDFKFQEEKDGSTIIRTGKYFYRWSKQGEVWLKNYDTNGTELNETRLGDAADKKGVLKVILSKHLYLENCVDMKLSMKD